MDTERKPESRSVERRGWTIQEFAKRWDTSTATIWRAISWDRLKPIYIGDRPIITAEDDQRVAREGLKLPRGYRRLTAGPVKSGRPPGKAKAKPSKPPKRTLRPRGEGRTVAP